MRVRIGVGRNRQEPVITDPRCAFLSLPGFDYPYQAKGQYAPR